MLSVGRTAKRTRLRTRWIRAAMRIRRESESTTEYKPDTHPEFRLPARPRSWSSFVSDISDSPPRSFRISSTSRIVNCRILEAEIRFDGSELAVDCSQLRRSTMDLKSRCFAKSVPSEPLPQDWRAYSS